MTTPFNASIVGGSVLVTKDHMRSMTLTPRLCKTAAIAREISAGLSVPKAPPWPSSRARFSEVMRARILAAALRGVAGDCTRDKSHVCCGYKASTCRAVAILYGTMGVCAHGGNVHNANPCKSNTGSACRCVVACGEGNAKARSGGGALAW